MATTAWRAARWLIRHADEIAPPAYLVLRNLLEHDEEVGEPGWHRIVCRFSRGTPVGSPEDYAQCKFDLIKITDNGTDNAWVPADFTAIGAALSTFWTSYRPQMGPSHQWFDWRAYRMKFNPDDPGPGGGPNNPPKPFMLTGPPVYQIGVGLGGTAANQEAYQVAMSLTLRTGWPRHWGRIYLPGLSSALDANGRIGSANAQTMANAAFDLLDDLAAAGFLWCVPMTQLQKQKFHGLLGVRDTVVDDVPDVVRRRRPKNPAFRRVGVE